MIRGNHDATIAALIKAIGNMQMENDQLRQANQEQMKTIYKYWDKSATKSIKGSQREA